MSVAVNLRVQSIRSQNPFGRGGCIFVGTEINEKGDIVDAKSYFVVRANGQQLGETRVQPGQWWSVTGEVQDYRRTTNGFLITERQIEAEDVALMRLSGEHIVSFIADSDEFEGIGLVKARRLWDTFGEELYQLLDAGDVPKLSAVLPVEMAEVAVLAWSRQGSTRTLQWLQGSGIDVRTGKKLIAFFGNEAEEKLADDPYRLLSFSASWKSVDAFARARFRVTEGDPRRLQAAVEEALYRLFDGGDTQTPIPTLLRRVESILGGSTHRPLVMAALEAGLTNGSYVIGDNGNVHLLGAMLMELTVAKAIASRLSPAPLLSTAQVNELIHEYEKVEGFDLNAEQKQAVHVAVQNPFAVILGGAGVGKTTVLKAVLKAYEAAGVGVHQMALSGRAAKRMTEATGLPSSTLARFFKNADSLGFEGPAVVVVDESSMVDVVTMHRLCELLPGHVRILLVGDTSQLMPVGPGLILHAVARVPEIPVVELVQVKRYGGAIAAAAADIRAGRWPSLPDDGVSAISFVPTKVADIPAVVVALYESDMGNTQILSGRKGNADGVQSLNEVCQSRFARQSPALLIRNEEFGVDMSVGLHLGDPVLCTRNLWEWGLQNGSLGTLVEIEKAPRLLSKPDGTELGHALAWVNWDDGERRPVTAEMLPDLELGYALTIHKSQGSQWRRIVVVLTGSRMLDRTLIYTAITRAQEQVIIVGDEAAAKAAVEAPPRAELRNVGLAQFLTQEIAANSEAALMRA